jgi:methionine-gamma-lyase
MTHSTYSDEELTEHLISPSLLRLSVGLEGIDDIIGDLDQAFVSLACKMSILSSSAA